MLTWTALHCRYINPCASLSEAKGYTLSTQRAVIKGRYLTRWAWEQAGGAAPGGWYAPNCEKFYCWRWNLLNLKEKKSSLISVIHHGCSSELNCHLIINCYLSNNLSLSYVPDSYLLFLLSLTIVCPPPVSPCFLLSLTVFVSSIPPIYLYSLLSYPCLEVNGWLQSVRAEWLITLEDRGCCSPTSITYIQSTQQHMSLLPSCSPIFCFSILVFLLEDSTIHLYLHILYILCRTLDITTIQGNGWD